MTGDPFVHLRVASGYSLRYGASAPAALVERAAEHGMHALALTDRDGVYGAVKFVQACRATGVRPLLGVDLAVADPEGGGGPRRGGAHRRGPARGGAFREAGHPRATVLAENGRGWASLCRLVSAAHLGGERGLPVTSLAEIAGRAGGLVVLLGPDSGAGRALARGRPDLARAVLTRWRAVVPDQGLVVAVTHHRGPGDAARAARLLGLAAELQLPAVLTNAVRHGDRRDAPTVDVLDAARRGVPLDLRHVDRVNGEAYLKSGKEMAELAEEVTRAAGAGESTGRALLARTRTLAERCVLDPRCDLGIGEPHLPELATTAGTATEPDAVLRQRCLAGGARRGIQLTHAVADRLAAELDVIAGLGYATYFLTVADVADDIRRLGVRSAARGSAAGSLVAYLLGISDVDPLQHGLLMERFLSPLRRQLPDIDIDVESARRTEVYDAILDRYGAERCTCVSMMDTYRARHAIRDVGAALGLPLGEIDTVAKAFPHVRASQVRTALAELPELRASGLADGGRLDLLFRLAERLDGLPRHVALHPCGVVLSDRTLLDRTPVEASWMGYPMSQFDKDDVEVLGLLKLDILGVRMQSAIAHALTEVARVDGRRVDIDRVPRDDPATFRLIRSTRTIGCFQIESPGQRELVGKFGPETFADLIVDISLFRPGPVKSDMVTPFLLARQGWRAPEYPHDRLRPALAETCGVVVFHEQVIRVIAVMTGCTLAEADEARRAIGEPDGVPEVRAWFVPAALRQGYDATTAQRVWNVLAAFASFGFCKAHAAAFAVPTYQSAWLKAHHPAAFLAGVLTHDPGMYPKRLILEDARQLGIAVLPLDVNVSAADYRVEKVDVHDEPPPAILGAAARDAPDPDLPDGRHYGIRLALSDVKGITAAEVARIVAGRPYTSLVDFWTRAAVSRPVVERLVVAGALDALYGIGCPLPVRRRGQVTRRDLLLQVAELDTWHRRPGAAHGRRPVDRRVAAAGDGRDPVRGPAARQSRAPAPVRPEPVQLTLDVGPGAALATAASGLPEMTETDRVRAELEVLGLDASRHVLSGYQPLLRALRVTAATRLLACRSRASVLVAGVKVATQTPPVRSGRRVVFVTLDDATGPVDATFFEEAQAGYAATLFHSWLLVIEGSVRRTGRRGVSLQADRCWDLTRLHRAWRAGGLPAVRAEMVAPAGVSEQAVHGAAASRAARPVMTAPPRRLWHASPGSTG